MWIFQYIFSITNLDNSPCNHIQKCTYSIFDWADYKYEYLQRRRLICPHRPPKRYKQSEKDGKPYPMWDYRNFGGYGVLVKKGYISMENLNMQWTWTLVIRMENICRNWHNKAHPSQIQTIIHKATNVREVCEIRPQQSETNRIRLTEGGNIIDYTGEFSTPTSNLTTAKLHVHIIISNIKYRFMCMDVKVFISTIAWKE